MRMKVSPTLGIIMSTEAAVDPDPLAMLRLMHLVSPALPIGAFNFSQGLEYAAEEKVVTDEATALDWIVGLARHSVGTLDLPILLRVHAACVEGDQVTAMAWSTELVASRETQEARAEERHLGQALAKLLRASGVEQATQWVGQPGTSHVAVFAFAAAHHGITPDAAAHGYLWAWAENQVIVAVKLLPIGQTAGQRILGRALVHIPQIVVHAQGMQDTDIGSAVPFATMASASHESQYTRLFRS
jgi:urease accessory protein